MSRLVLVGGIASPLNSTNHPTLGEALMEAAQHALGHAIHIANR